MSMTAEQMKNATHRIHPLNKLNVLIATSRINADSLVIFQQMKNPEGMHVTTPAAANFVDSVIVTDLVLNETDVTVAVVVTTDVKPPKKKRPCQSSKEEVISGCKSTTSSTTLGAILIFKILNDYYSHFH